jgi:hypothetical protein
VIRKDLAAQGFHFMVRIEGVVSAAARGMVVCLQNEEDRSAVSLVSIKL